MKERYVLSPSILLRKEDFGGIIFNPGNECIRPIWVYVDRPTFRLLGKKIVYPDQFEKESWEIFRALGFLIRSDILSEFVKPDSKIVWEKEWNAASGYLSSPTHLCIELNKSCNLRCSYCYAGSSKKEPKDCLSCEDWIRVAEICGKWGVFEVILGGGEPFLRNDLVSIVQAFRENHVLPNLTTNGTLITPSVAESLAGIAGHINVSIDGDRETYYRIRGVDAYESAMRGVRILQKAGASVGVNIMITRVNFDKLANFLSFLESIGIRDVTFLRLQAAGRGARKKVIENLQLTEEQRHQIPALFNQLENSFQGLIRYADSFRPLLYCDREATNGLSNSCCNGGFTFFSVTYNGNVAPCSFLHGKFDAGHILRDDFKDIWHKYMSSWRKTILVKEEPCRSCALFSVCKGGCAVDAFSTYGTYSACDPFCARRISKQA